MTVTKWKEDGGPSYQFGESFTIKLNENQFGKQSLIHVAGDPVPMIVTKVYPFTWWRKILFHLGFGIKSMEVKPLNENNGNE